MAAGRLVGWRFDTAGDGVLSGEGGCFAGWEVSVVYRVFKGGKWVWTHQAEAEQVRHAQVAILLQLELEVRSTMLAVVRGHSEGRQNHAGHHQPQISSGEVLLVGLGQVVQLVPGVRVVQVVLRLPEDLGQLGVVNRHHLRLGRLLDQSHEAVDVLNGSECLLPELKLGGNLKLLKAGLQDLAQAAELSHTLVLLAELKCAVGSHSVERLQLRVVAQDLQNGAVRLPQEPVKRGRVNTKCATQPDPKEQTLRR
eukprot:907468-Prorocentrum_minimum.AAC.2